MLPQIALWATSIPQPNATCTRPPSAGLAFSLTAAEVGPFGVSILSDGARASRYFEHYMRVAVAVAVSGHFTEDGVSPGVHFYLHPRESLDLSQELHIILVL